MRIALFFILNIAVAICVLAAGLLFGLGLWGALLAVAGVLTALQAIYVGWMIWAALPDMLGEDPPEGDQPGPASPDPVGQTKPSMTATSSSDQPPSGGTSVAPDQPGTKPKA